MIEVQGLSPPGVPSRRALSERVYDPKYIYIDDYDSL